MSLSDTGLQEELAQVAAEADCLRKRASTMLRQAARRAAAAGMSQREIAGAIGRSQPEVSRLLRFAPSSPKGRVLAAKRREVIELLKAAGHSNPRVFGSVAHGEDHAESDIDLLVDVAPGTTLFDLAEAELALGRLLDGEVQLTPASGLRTRLRGRVLAEAVPL